jgi:hypothetical protein
VIIARRKIKDLRLGYSLDYVLCAQFFEPDSVDLLGRRLKAPANQPGSKNCAPQSLF